MKSVALTVAIIFTLGLCGVVAARIINDIVFDRNCGGYLKRAADSNTVEMARKQLTISVEYMEEEDLTDGYTSVIYNTPDEDVNFWYNNVSKALEELKNMKPEATPLERSNMLMKLRETLLDNEGDGDKITVPSGIHLFPHNTRYAVWAIVLLFLACLAWFLFFIDELRI